jgi:hypothetical protein
MFVMSVLVVAQLAKPLRERALQSLIRVSLADASVEARM